MNIPTFSRQKFVDSDGDLTSPMQNAFDVFFQQAQENISDDGFVIPSRTTKDINDIASTSNANNKPDGTIWYDNEDKELKAKIDGVVKIIQTI